MNGFLFFRAGAVNHCDGDNLSEITPEGEETYKIHEEMIVVAAWLEDFEKSENWTSGVLGIS